MAPQTRRTASRQKRQPAALNTHVPSISLGENLTPDIRAPSRSPSPQLNSPTDEQTPALDDGQSEPERGRPLQRSRLGVPSENLNLLQAGESLPAGITIRSSRSRGPGATVPQPATAAPQATTPRPVTAIPQPTTAVPQATTPQPVPVTAGSTKPRRRGRMSSLPAAGKGDLQSRRALEKEHSDDEDDEDDSSDFEGDPKVDGPLRRGRRSIGEVALRGDDVVSTMVDQISEKVKHLRDDIGIRKALRQVKTRLKKIKKYKLPNGITHDNIKSISFSHVDEDDLPRLGIRPRFVPLSHAQTTEMFPLRDHEKEEAIRGFTQNLTDEKGFFYKMLSVVMCGFYTRLEAFSRTVIDFFGAMYGVMLMLNSIFDMQSFVLTEATLKKREVDDNQKMIDIIWDGKVTLLSGRLDFVFSSWPGDFEDFKAVPRGKAQISKNFITDFPLLTGYEWNKELRLFVVEAKSNQTEAELRKHIPQVAAQCRAVAKVANLDAVIWCLSTGTMWIFGALVADKARAQPDFNNSQWTLFVSEPLEWDIKRSATILPVFHTFAHWAMAAPDDIGQAFRGYQAKLVQVQQG
ncbi:hypothetical protein BDN72DRAFT_957049 [Pluteus cervinus]|uniref:Uncharacterized protein n=1 Tax=Pluteus cervinus TaxID=181527 RepID=A0ACD3B4A5_9AGAR|nr:hypothetical protein BDN72DRAFT_957049 [Pluteus cervinus]